MIPDTVVREALHRLGVIADTYLSVSSRVQQDLRDLLDTADAVQRDVRTRLDTNRAIAREVTLATDGLVHLLPAHGGWSFILEVPRVMDDVAWARVLEASGVRVLAGSLFDLRGGRSLVVSLLPQPEVFRAGMALLCATVVRLSRE